MEEWYGQLWLIIHQFAFKCLMGPHVILTDPMKIYLSGGFWRW
jgi:hypothetical protein